MESHEMNIFHKILSTKFGAEILFRRFTHLFGYLLTEVLWKRYRHFLGSFRRIGQKSRQFTDWSWKYALICVENRKKNSEFTRSASAHAQDRITKGTHRRNMYVCYKRERLFEIFVSFFCHNICLRGKCYLSEWEILEMKPNCAPKELFRATLISSFAIPDGLCETKNHLSYNNFNLHQTIQF